MIARRCLLVHPVCIQSHSPSQWSLHFCSVLVEASKHLPRLGENESHPRTMLEFYNEHRRRTHCVLIETSINSKELYFITPTHKVFSRQTVKVMPCSTLKLLACSVFHKFTSDISDFLVNLEIGQGDRIDCMKYTKNIAEELSSISSLSP